MSNQTLAPSRNPIPPDDTRSPSIEVSIPPDDGKKIVKLLQRHCVVREDDTAESAATRLASMALTLANIASGHLRVIVDGIEHDPAMDFIVEGGITAADFANIVIGSVEWIQGRCERNSFHDVAPTPRGQEKNPNLNRLHLYDINEAEVLPALVARKIFAVGHVNYQKALNDDETKAQREGRGALYSPEQALQSCKKHLTHRQVGDLLVSKRQDTLLREALEYSLFFVRVTTPAGLRGQSARAHLGRLLVYAEIDSAATLEAMRKEVADIGARNGSGSAKRSPVVRANLCLSAATGILDEVVAAGGYQQKSIPQLLWLVETSAGCGLPEIREASPVASRPDFRKACRTEIACRIGFLDEDSYHLKSLDGHMAGWRLFLNEQERYLPGIAKVAYNLPVALGYGLEKLNPKKIELDGSEVMAWAKWLVLRMSNRVAAARATGRDSRSELLATRLAEKLAEEGPMTVRKLTRRFSKLKADDCRKALTFLAEQGVVGEQGGTWGMLGKPGAPAQKVQERKTG